MSIGADHVINRVILYLRVSLEKQVEKFSLDAQAKLTRETAERNGWEVVEVIRDEGYSGSWIEERPGFNKILQMATAGQFDAVVVTDQDRLARPDNLKDLGRIQELFIRHHIRIVTLSGITDLSRVDDWFHSSLESLFAGWERKKISQRTKRGIQMKQERGEPLGGIQPGDFVTCPFGTRYHRLPK